MLHPHDQLIEDYAKLKQSYETDMQAYREAFTALQARITEMRDANGNADRIYRLRDELNALKRLYASAMDGQVSLVAELNCTKEDLREANSKLDAISNSDRCPECPAGGCNGSRPCNDAPQN